MTEFFLDFPELTKQWHDVSNYIVVLAVENEEKLHRIFERATNRDIRCSQFREPDMDDQLTAIVLEPGPRSKKLCGHLKLAG